MTAPQVIGELKAIYLKYFGVPLKEEVRISEDEFNEARAKLLKRN